MDSAIILDNDQDANTFSLLRFGPEGKIRSTWSMASWAKDPLVQKAWADLTKTREISISPFQKIDQTFGPVDFAVTTSWAYSIR